VDQPHIRWQGGQSGGQGITTGTITDPRPRVLTEEKQAEVDALVASGATRNQVIEQTGLKANTAQRAMEKARERNRRQAAPEPEPMEEAHTHDWGPWVRLRQCAECGEQEVEEG
jgi:hypothetical protein